MPVFSPICGTETFMKLEHAVTFIYGALFPLHRELLQELSLLLSLGHSTLTKAASNSTGCQGQLQA